jgi:putative ABC transport system permease protein
MILESVLRDIRFARRNLARTPVVAAAAILSIGLGIAATTAMVSVVDAALFRQPPLPHAEQLVMLYETRAEPNEAPVRERWSWARSALLRQRAASFADVASYSNGTVAMSAAGADPEPLTIELVSASYLRTLMVPPAIGHDFDVVDETVPTPQIIIAYALWQRRFGGELSVIGRVVMVDGVPLTIVGIAPRGFSGLSGQAQAWVPAAMATVITYRDYLTTDQSFISVVARLRDRVSVERAKAELAVLGPAIRREIPGASRKAGVTFGATAMTVNDARIDPTTRRPMLLLLAAAGCLLLLSCANVSGLLLGRAASRRREMAVRVAVGASRSHIVRQMVVESLLLSIAGGAIGVVAIAPLAGLLTPPRATARGRNFYGAVGEFATTHIDVRVVAFCGAMCLVTALVIGVIPALRAARVDLTRDLKDGAAGTGIIESDRIVTRQTIVALETMLAVLLLFCGGLLLTTWQRLGGTNPGFDPSHLLTFMVRPSEAEYPPPKAALLLAKLLAALRDVHGVVGVTIDGCAPASTGCANSTLYVVGRAMPRPDDAPPVLRHYIAPDHFRVLVVPILSGRAFTDADRSGGPRVAIINELAARRFWPNENPIGKRVWFGGGSSFDRPDSSAEIVGVVGNVAYQALDEQPYQPDFYTPYAQFTYASRMVMIRTRGEPLNIVSEVRHALQEVEPTLALFDVEPMTDRIRDSWARLTQQTRLLGAFAGLALLLAGAGIFGVIAQVIGERRREIGVRAALGASSADLLRCVGQHGARPATTGALIGLVISMAAGRVIAATVHGVPAFDVSVAAIVTLTMIGVIALAAGLAARRALDIAPSESLKA